MGEYLSIKTVNPHVNFSCCFDYIYIFKDEECILVIEMFILLTEWSL